MPERHAPDPQSNSRPAVYLSAAITGYERREVLSALVSALQAEAAVLAEHVATVGPDGGAPGLNSDDPEAIWRYDMQLLDRAQLVVCELSVRSLGVGYEIRRAQELGLPVLGLIAADAGRLSAMIAGCGIEVQRYESIEQACALALAFVRAQRPGEVGHR